MARKRNPLVFLDVSIGDEHDERMVFELFADAAPVTAENFRALCTGEMGIGQKTKKPLCYKGSTFHRVIKGLMAQGGGFSKGKGSGGESIYGGNLADENSDLRHDDRGLLTTADTGSRTNGSQFCITFKPNSHLDRKHTVFGKLILGNDVLKRIEQVNVHGPDSSPIVPITIVDCGELDRKDHGSVTTENDKKRTSKSRSSKVMSSDEENDGQIKAHHKKSAKRRRKKRRYSYSETDSSSESETESSDSESDSDTYSSDSSDLSSSSDDRRRHRKKHSKRNKRKRAKRKRDHRRERRRRKRDRKSKHKSKRVMETDSETESASDGDFEDGKSKRHRRGRKSKASSHVSAENLAAVASLKDAASTQQKSGISRSPAQEDNSPPQNGEIHINGVTESKTERNVDIMPSLTGYRSKSRSQSMSANHSMSKSMSISPRRSPVKRPVTSQKRLSRSPSPPRKATSPPPNNSRSPSRSGSPDGSPKRIRRGRGFTQRYSFARQYRSPSADRPYRYGGRSDRDRYMSYRGSRHRSPPRRFRSPPRGRASPRYRRRSRSISRSPVRRDRGRGGGYSRSPVRSRSPLAGKPRPHGARARSVSRSPSRSRSPAPVRDRTPADSPSPRRSDDKSRSVSVSPDGKKGLVSYGDASPDSAEK
ncbi:hypothetical protein QOZ80_2BG0159010 [Eleusine coracana subsp. coracana]|nr:hypothetical protein QOZ80_2BG0159010 [Eleusine coracana subsp. coracana]